MLAGALYGQKVLPETWLDTLDKNVKYACEQQALDLLTLSTK